MPVAVAEGSVLLGVAAASPELAASKPPPVQLLCSPSLMGATLVNGICVLPGIVPGAAHDDIEPLAVSNPTAGTRSRSSPAPSRPD
jgi:hypothetical protein